MLVCVYIHIHVYIHRRSRFMCMCVSRSRSSSTGDDVMRGQTAAGISVTETGAWKSVLDRSSRGDEEGLTRPRVGKRGREL